jgi:hypothetical protein
MMLCLLQVWDDEIAEVAQGWAVASCPTPNLHDTIAERYIPGLYKPLLIVIQTSRTPVRGWCAPVHHGSMGLIGLTVYLFAASAR